MPRLRNTSCAASGRVRRRRHLASRATAAAADGGSGGGASNGASSTAGGLAIDLRGKTAFVAGVADDQGFGWAISKALAEAGARVLVGTWVPVRPALLPLSSASWPQHPAPRARARWQPPRALAEHDKPLRPCSACGVVMKALSIFETSLRRGKFDESRKCVSSNPSRLHWPNQINQGICILEFCLLAKFLRGFISLRLLL
eukprot:SM005621S18325  [mRNA]  locus=s5621:201:953:- [translate_table: standard]